MKKAAFALIWFSIALTCAFTYEWPVGGEEWYRFNSPAFMSGGDSSVSVLSPGADALNPAASGGQQRVTLDLNYIGLVDFAGGAAGHAINLGGTLPTRYGVGSGSVHFLYSPFSPVLNFGTVGSANISFAKDLYPDLYIGAGMKIVLGSGKQVDWGLGLDLGFLYFAGDVGALKDLRVGGVFRNIGKPYDPSGRSGYVSAPFTPAVGTGFTLLRNSTFNVGLTGDLSFPFFQDVRFQAGANATFKNFITLSTSLALDLKDLLAADAARSLIPSLGVTVDLNRNRKKDNGVPESWKDTEVGIQTSVSPLFGKIWGFGTGVNVPLGVIDKRAPEINIDYKNVMYISPNHDGKSDYLEFPLSITDERYVKGFRFVVEDEKGNVVREINNKEVRPENSTIKSLLDRVRYVKTGITVPDRITWEGTGNGGSAVPDGQYGFYVEAWDDNGNTGRTNAYTVFVDMNTPSVDLKTPEDPVDLIFSPDGDGNKDSLAIVQSGSVEDLWDGKITDSQGNTVKSFEWKSASPADFPWDGKNAQGILAPDGVYSYVITSTDRAQNSTSRRIDNIIINTQQPPVRLQISSANFSPDGNGIQDELEIIPDVPVQTGIAGWTLTIRDESGSTVRTLNGENGSATKIPESIMFDGRYGNGSYLPEGRYRAFLGVLYQNGHNPKTESPVFTLDVTPPAVRVRTEYKVFSPNGDGQKENVTFYQETSNEDYWTGTITDSTDSTIQETVWTGKADATFTWDGRGVDRKILPDGTYFYTVASVDRAGNRGSSEKIPVVMDTRETPIALSAQDEAFSPNNDGLKDRIDLLPQLKITDGLESWELSICSESGTPVRTQRAVKKDGIQFAWDGVSDNGVRSADGRYYAILKLRYVNGNTPSALTGNFLLDTVAPKSETRANYTIFSPNSDGNKDEIAITQESSKEARWTGTIQNADGKVVKSYSWIGEADKSISWDGRGDDKLVQPDGLYTYRLTSIDLAGNKGVSEPVSFSINTEETPLFISAEYDAFSPNSDGVKDNIRFVPQIKVMDGLQTYSLSIRSKEGEVVKKYSGDAGTVNSLRWDGSTDPGKRTPDGSYYAELSLLYLNGNAPAAKTSVFQLDTAPPKATVKADYTIFSPNSDGNKDIITFAQDTSREDTWTGTIVNATGKPVKVFTWSGKAEQKLFWDGRGNDKSIVPDGTYKYQLLALDEAGNRGSSSEIAFELTTADTPLFMSSEYGSFSPNGDGTRDTIRLFPQAKVERGLEKYEIRILSASRDIVRSFSGTQKTPQTINWDGLDGKGKPVTDGAYTVEFSASYDSGNMPTADAVSIVLDTVYPDIRITPDLALFSPNGDGNKDTVMVRQSSTAEDLWDGRILSDRGEVVRSFTWKGKALDFSWDGLDQNGNRVKDGNFRYSVVSTDGAGNRTEKASETLTIDTRATSVFITAGRTGFSPNGDGMLDDMTFQTLVNIQDGIEAWTMTLSDDVGSIQKVFTGKTLPPASIVWDGRNENGIVKEGVYTAQLTVMYQKGDKPTASTKSFTIDVSAPTTEVTLKPVPFSPDNDGINDEVTIGLRVKDKNSIENWKFEILDPAGHTFIAYSGNGIPSEKIVWDGLSSSAELVQAAEDYPYVFTVKDSLGNVATKKGAISVDVLVIRETDKLKIRISSINFPAYRSDLIWENNDASAKNIKILKRLAEILNKYSSYKVRIEGHAVSEYWNNPSRAAREEVEELQPLSLKRADAVKNKLVEFGVDPSRLTILGRGGVEPIVPHGDLENRWKNRRVEFILIK